MSEPNHRAVQLRAQGHSYAEIARVLGVSKSTARRLADPEIAEAHLRQAREWKRRHRTACPRCGQLVSWDRPGQLCATCVHDAEYGERNTRIFAAWERGESGTMIAEAEGIDASTVHTLVDFHRRRYGTQLALHRVPNRTHWEHIQRRWNEDGATLKEIATELGYQAPQNVSEQIRQMRVAGVDVKRRRAAA